MAVMFSEKDFKFIKSLILEAGDTALDMQKKGVATQTKVDGSPVTEADVIVQDLIIRKISERYPDAKFIVEEGNICQDDDINDDTLLFVVDPIDGTAMFSMCLPEWCVSVGVFQGFVPRYGFVYSPGMNLFFYNDNEHSYLNGEIKVAEQGVIIDRETTIFFASELNDIFPIRFPGKIRNLGSTALHAALIIDNARNRALAFIGKSYLWDWAAAFSIISKAGGKVRYLSGGDVNIRDIIQGKCVIQDKCIAFSIEDFSVIQGIFSPDQ